MNTWKIPDWLEKEVRNRDRICVYCGIEMIEKVPAGRRRRAAATWEHIMNDARIVTRENIARCCAGCNSSKGARSLATWIESPYCRSRGITKDSVAEVVREVLRDAVGANTAPSTPEGTDAATGRRGSSVPPSNRSLELKRHVRSALRAPTGARGSSSRR